MEGGFSYSIKCKKLVKRDWLKGVRDLLFTPKGRHFLLNKTVSDTNISYFSFQSGTLRNVYAYPQWNAIFLFNEITERPNEVILKYDLLENGRSTLSVSDRFR